MAKRRRRLGGLGERLAQGHLLKLGYNIRETNYRRPLGEIDIVAEKGAYLVFVEVRTRQGQEMGTPEESITAAKKERLISLAHNYLQEHGEEERPFRIDLVAVELSAKGVLQRVEVIENAVEG